MKYTRKTLNHNFLTPESISQYDLSNHITLTFAVLVNLVYWKNVHHLLQVKMDKLEVSFSLFTVKNFNILILFVNKLLLLIVFKRL